MMLGAKDAEERVRLLIRQGEGLTVELKDRYTARIPCSAGARISPGTVHPRLRYLQRLRWLIRPGSPPSSVSSASSVVDPSPVHWIGRFRRSQQIRDPQRLRINAYRVLLTRGRDGLVVFVPPGLDSTWEALRGAGFEEL